jgi:hypothetical protein
MFEAFNSTINGCVELETEDWRGFESDLSKAVPGFF